MARGVNFSNTYGTNSLTDFIGGGGQSVAELALQKVGLTFEDVGGSSLPGYDIKSQDAATMVRLSLIAENQGESLSELYVDNTGVVQRVDVGKTIGVGPTRCLTESFSSNFVEQVDHVVVRGRKPSPIRVNKSLVNLTGPGTVTPSPFLSCTAGRFRQRPLLNKELAVIFQRSPQSGQSQQALRSVVNRAGYEKLVGYRYQLPDIPSDISFSLSQQAPVSINFPINIGALGASYSLNLSNPYEVSDISGLQIVGAQVLDIVRGPDLGVSEDEAPLYTFGDNDYFVMLDNSCGLIDLGRGSTWWFVDGGRNTGVVLLRPTQGGAAAYSVFGSQLALNSAANVYLFRRNSESIASMSDFVSSNRLNGDPPLDTINGEADETFREEVSPGLAGNFGIEFNGNAILSYSVQAPSVVLRSTSSALGAAQTVAGQGIGGQPIVIKEPPPPVALNGQIVKEPEPREENSTDPVQNNPLEELEGRIVSITAPFLGSEVAELSANLLATINNSSGKHTTRTYVAGGFSLLPGMVIDGEIVHSIEHKYADKNSVTTTVVTGPSYYQPESFNDSQYYKQTDTIQRTGRVIAGNNTNGYFYVYIPDLGGVNAINSIIQPVYVGDNVDVKILNFPLE